MRKQLAETEARMREDEDPADNARDRLPENTEVTWPGFWMIEVFAPSSSAALADGIDKINEHPSGVIFRPFGAEEIKSSRTSAGGWSTLDPVHDSPYTGKKGRIGLPKHFETAQMTVMQVAPGLSIVVTQFTLEEAEWKRLQDTARADYPSKSSPSKGFPGETISHSQQQRGKAIKAARDEYRDLAAQWLKSLIPGTFATLGKRPPAFDFLLLGGEYELPTDSEKNQARHTWLETLGIETPHGRWICQTNDGLRLQFDRILRDTGSVPTFIGNQEDLKSLTIGYEGITSIFGALGRGTTNLMSLWALESLMLLMQRTFATTADELSQPTGLLRTGAKIRRLTDDVMPMSFDIRTIQAGTQHHLFPGLGRETVRFDPDKEGPGAQYMLDEPLGEQLVKRARAAATEAASISDRITDGLRVQSELILAASNMRIQWALMGLTVAIGIATIVFAT